MAVPRAELQAVRFDGPRGYAITFERTDPLFTLDLSDPANPLQVGELAMPGWVYYMEPRGDRVIGLGFDQGNAEGSLTVSIFDVSELSEPTMVDRVNFGGDWAELAEDQGRIHKSFQVLDSNELILVPFSGWVYDEVAEDECREGSYVSGVQLIDWADDSLELRGVAPSRGQSRRAFILDERLLTMSNERLEAFDISDRGEPVSTSVVDLAQIVNQLATVGDTVVRVGDDWWQPALQATVSSLDDLLGFEPGVGVKLPNINNNDCYTESWLDSLAPLVEHDRARIRTELAQFSAVRLDHGARTGQEEAGLLRGVKGRPDISGDDPFWLHSAAAAAILGVVGHHESREHLAALLEQRAVHEQLRISCRVVNVDLPAVAPWTRSARSR